MEIIISNAHLACWTPKHAGLTLADVVEDARSRAAAVGAHAVPSTDAVLVVAVCVLLAVADAEALAVLWFRGRKVS